MAFFLSAFHIWHSLNIFPLLQFISRPFNYIKCTLMKPHCMLVYCIQNVSKSVTQSKYTGQKQIYPHYGFNMAWFDKDGDGMQTNELKTFYCISTDIKQTMLPLSDTNSMLYKLFRITEYSTQIQFLYHNYHDVNLRICSIKLDSVITKFIL